MIKRKVPSMQSSQSSTFAFNPTFIFIFVFSRDWDRGRESTCRQRDAGSTAGRGLFSNGNPECIRHSRLNSSHIRRQRQFSISVTLLPLDRLFAAKERDGGAGSRLHRFQPQRLTGFTDIQGVEHFAVLAAGKKYLDRLPRSIPLDLRLFFIGPVPFACAVDRLTVHLEPRAGQLQPFNHLRLPLAARGRAVGDLKTTALRGGVDQA